MSSNTELPEVWYQKYDNWQLYEGEVQTLFKGGPNTVDREFKTYEEVWFLKKKTVKVTQNVVEINFFIKIYYKIHILTNGHIFW